VSQPDAPMGNLPRQVTSFVGHEDQLTAIAAELEQSAVVTLTGVGGVGKTRLALEVAARQGPGYRDGAWLCALAGVREADGVADAVLEAFRVEPPQGLPAEEVLRRFLRAKELLLVLDNCEHLLRPLAGLVTEVLRECRGVRVLATSREGLSIAGERIMVVPSLDVPVSTEDLDAIAGSDAVQLFVSRARAVRAGFVLDGTNASSVAQICQRLDGVPLAIELAAARAAMLTPAELARRLDQRFRVLTGSDRGVVERHQTLRASIDWSYELLGDAERRLLDRLSVFVGGFTLAAAEAVTAGDGIEPGEVFELLAGLVARSLVVADMEGAETRYRLLETIRQYAQDRLESDGMAAHVRDAHLRYFTTFVEEVASGVSTAAELEWVERAAKEVDNVRAALAWAIETEDAEAILRFFGREELWSAFSEIGRVLEAAAPAALRIAGLVDDCRYPLMLAFAAMHAFGRGNVDDMRRYCEDALAAEARLGCEASVSVAAARSMVGTAAGDVDELIEYRDRAVAICRARQDYRRLAFNLANSALGRALDGKDMARAVAEIDEALSVAQQVAAPRIGVVQGFAAFVLADVQPERARELMRAAMAAKASNRIPGPIESMLGDVAERLGDRRQALELFAQGLEGHHWLGQPELVGRALRRIGLLLVDNDPQTAAILIGAAAQGSRAINLTQRAQDHHARGIAELGAALGADRFRELQAAGAAMDEHDAVELARTAVARALSSAVTSDHVEPVAGPVADGNIFRREGDVWRLDFDGVTVRLRDAKGLRYLACLLAEPGRELHVRDLAAEATGGEAVPASDSGGEVIDDTAKRAYQRRLADLEADLAEATEWNDTERAARAEAEMDALTEQLAGAYGLGGRARSMGDPVERMRKAVTNRIKDSLDHIAAQHEALGRHLTNSVHTGTFCSYTPERPTTWEL
jgi:predicted ATPase